MKRVAAVLITLALVVGMVGCPADPEPTPLVEYSLTISSSEGGEVTTPGEAVFVYGSGEVVSLVAAPASGYYFGGWTGDVSIIANTRAASTTITMNGDYSITASFQMIPIARYNLTVSSTEGGQVTAPGEGTFTYDAGTVVNLVTEADEGYTFMEWTGDVDSVTDVTAASTTVTMTGDYTITANFAKEIRTWYDLDAVRDNLSGNYVLVNDLDSATPGYSDLAGPTANDGKGWEPIGTIVSDPFTHGIVEAIDPFAGSLNGKGYEIRDLFLGRLDEDGVGLFSAVGQGASVQSLGLVSLEVSGRFHVGGLSGANAGTVSNCYSGGRVTGDRDVGGLVGENFATVSDSHSDCSVMGGWGVGGLVGGNAGTISNCRSSGDVTGGSDIGGLMGRNWGAVSSSYSSGDVTGYHLVGGLVGRNWGVVSNSHYNHDEVRINGKNAITIGALFAEDFCLWLDDGKLLNINERLSKEGDYYMIGDVGAFRQLLAFGQDGSLRFKMKSDVDLANDPGLYIPYLAGEFDGNGHRILNLKVESSCAGHVGVFGYLASGAVATRVGVAKADITGGWIVGPLVGWNYGTVSNSYSTGSVIEGQHAGGLVGWNYGGTVVNSYYNYDEVLVNGKATLAVGALFSDDFEEWLANNRRLDVDNKLSREDGYYVISSVDDFTQLLAFGQDGSLKFRLANDLDLGNDPGLYIPYLAGRLDGNGHRVTNLTLNVDAACVGLFGYLASGAYISGVGVENVNITGGRYVGGLVGQAYGTVSNSYSTGTVTGGYRVGGLVGDNCGTVSRSYSDCDVTGTRAIGGLVGLSASHVRDSYSAGSATGHECVGGLLGENWGSLSNSHAMSGVNGSYHVGGLVGWGRGIVVSSLWDKEASGIEASHGGIGKTTTEMKSIATFTRAGWSIIAVAPGQRNTAYIWNIVDGQTYPFLSWQQFP